MERARTYDNRELRERKGLALHAMHETKWWNAADPERILANHIIGMGSIMGCPCPWDGRVIPDLRVSPVGDDVCWTDVRLDPHRGGRVPCGVSVSLWALSVPAAQLSTQGIWAQEHD